jgi:hypothetical protein
VNKGALSIVLTSLLKRGLLRERLAGREDEVWREHDGEKLTLILTEDGLKAVGAESAESHTLKAGAAKAQVKSRSQGAAAKASKRSHAGRPGQAPETKQARLVGLLKRKAGATIDEVMEATGWQAHSVRGAISGTLKKKLGLKVESEIADGRGRVYRIAAGR